MLYNEVEKPIIPIAIFSYNEAWENDLFNMKFKDFEVLRFHYLTLHLRKQNWRTFIKKDNPITAALLSKMGYTEEERVQVKLEFFKMLARLELDREKNHLLLGFFESYLHLTEEEEEIFVQEAKRLENAEEILELPISYEERGKKIGEKIGKEIGRSEERKVVARNMLKDGFSVEKIAELTQLDPSEIKGLREEL